MDGRNVEKPKGLKLGKRQQGQGRPNQEVQAVLLGMTRRETSLAGDDEKEGHQEAGVRAECFLLLVSHSFIRPTD